MDDGSRDRREAELAALRDAGDFHRAATRAVEVYGSELLAYLLGVVRNETDAREAFSLVCEAMWEGLPRFRGDCSFRTWAYALARHALGRIARERTQQRRHVELAPEMDLAAQSARASTPQFLRTETRKRIDLIRSELDPDDRELLILRVNRELSWPEIARIELGPEAQTAADVERTAASLRKRFERLKEKLRAKASGRREKES